MNLAVTFTVNDRPDYFIQSLETWANVRNKEDVLFYFNCEPFEYVDGNNRGTCVDMAEKWIRDNKVIGRVYCNTHKFGVLHNPYVAFSRAFNNLTIDYAILAEDDLLVSSDILEYHQWCAESYLYDTEIAVAASFNSQNTTVNDSLLARVPGFPSPLVWGTWRDRWVEYIDPTWDHDYSTGDGHQMGWDWNLNLRVLPKLAKKTLQPLTSRVQNIGAVGTHATGGDYITAPTFVADRQPTDYIEVR